VGGERLEITAGGSSLDIGLDELRARFETGLAPAFA
jgi:hypothetical protein